MSTQHRDWISTSEGRGAPGAAASDAVGMDASIFDALPGPMALVDVSGTIITVNHAWRRLAGVDSADDAGQPLTRRFSAHERPRVSALLSRHGRPGQERPIVAGTQLRRDDGTRVDVALRLATVSCRDEDVTIVQLEPLAADREHTTRPPGTGDRQLALATIARAVATGGDLRRIAATVIATVARATGCPLVGLWRRASRGEALLLVTGAGFSSTEHGRLTLDTDPAGLAGHTLRTRNVVVIGGPNGTAAHVPAVLRERGVASGAAVGIYGTAGADGLLTISAPNPQPVSAELVRFLGVVGDLLSMAAQREAVDDLITAERQRTAGLAADLIALRQRHDMVRQVAQVIELRWTAPLTAALDKRMSPPPRIPLTACLDGGPQAVLDAANDDDVEQLAEHFERCIAGSAELDTSARVHTADGVVTVRLRGLAARRDDGTVEEINGFAMVVATGASAGSTPSSLEAYDDGARLAHTAHDLNNLLAAILGTTEQMVEQGPDRARLMAVVRAGRRARELVGGLQPDSDFEHPLAGAYELADVVAHLEPLLPGLAGPHANLQFELHRGARTAALPRHEVERIVLNLVSNSCDAIDSHGTITVTVDTCIQLSDSRDDEPAPPVGRWARIAVSDDGAGVPAADRSRVFERGFTTKRSPQHGGLGLASVRDAVGASGGVIRISGAAGAGTTVEIFLPLATGRTARLQPLRPPALPAARSAPAVAPASTAPATTAGSAADAATEPDAPADARRTALLVDDEPAVRHLLGELLQRLDFDVTSVGDGSSALAAAGTLDQVDLLVTDLRMPGMDGLTLGRHLRRQHPRAAIVLLTGAPPSAPIADRKLRVVRKPFDWEALRDAVISVLPAAAIRPVDPSLSHMYGIASG